MVKQKWRKTWCVVSSAGELTLVGYMRLISPSQQRGHVFSALVVHLISSVSVAWTSWRFLQTVNDAHTDEGGPARAQKDNRRPLPCLPGRKEVRPRTHCARLRAAPGGPRPHCCCPGWMRRGCLLCLLSPGANPSCPQTGRQEQRRKCTPAASLVTAGLCRIEGPGGGHLASKASLWCLLLSLLWDSHDRTLTCHCLPLTHHN